MRFGRYLKEALEAETQPPRQLQSCASGCSRTSRAQRAACDEPFAFSAGSLVLLHEGAHARVLETEATGARVLLESGASLRLSCAQATQPPAAAPSSRARAASHEAAPRPEPAPSAAAEPPTRAHKAARPSFEARREAGDKTELVAWANRAPGRRRGAGAHGAVRAKLAFALTLALWSSEGQTRPMQQASYDVGRAARIVARRSLFYRDGARPELDRPAHVRAASGLAWIGDELAIIQDDANFVALVEPATGGASAIALPAGAGGVRLFDDTRGNKSGKLDLEACFAIAAGDATQLIALGSGTKALRERIVVLSFAASGRAATQVRVLDATPFYAALHRAVEFSGSELNLEGALVRDESLLLVQRGNGAIRDGRAPRNAIGELSLAAFLRYLADPADAAAVPPLRAIHAYDLGTVDGVAFSFTDATLSPTGELVFLASAEASSDSVNDGAVYGTRVGEIDRDGDIRVGPLLDEQGAATRLKAEGIAIDRRDPSRAWIVVDMDDPARAAELLDVRLAQPGAR